MRLTPIGIADVRDVGGELGRVLVLADIAPFRSPDT
jgi:hypothetical protein